MLNTQNIDLENLGELAFVRDISEKKYFRKEVFSIILGVSYRTLHRWIVENNRKPSNLAKDKIREIMDIFKILHQALPEKGIYEWLNRYNKYLNGEKPVEMLVSGRYREAYDAAKNLRDNPL